MANNLLTYENYARLGLPPGKHVKALGWQSVGVREDGRYAVRNPNGQVQTEYQSTIDNPYGPGFVNIPTIYGGNPPVEEDQAREIMMNNNMVDPDTGSSHYQQSFPTPEAAVETSMRNSNSIKWKPGGQSLGDILAEAMK